MLTLPPAILVHGLSQARRALHEAVPVTLLSAPGAALFMGCLWWRELLAASGHNGPALLDCACAPGRAAEALALGLPGIILAPCPGWDEIARQARQNSAILLEKAPDFLDLGLKGGEMRLKTWLHGA